MSCRHGVGVWQTQSPCPWTEWLFCDSPPRQVLTRCEICQLRAVHAQLLHGCTRKHVAACRKRVTTSCFAVHDQASIVRSSYTTFSKFHNQDVLAISQCEPCIHIRHITADKQQICHENERHTGDSSQYQGLQCCRDARHACCWRHSQRDKAAHLLRSINGINSVHPPPSTANHMG